MSLSRPGVLQLCSRLTSCPGFLLLILGMRLKPVTLQSTREGWLVASAGQSELAEMRTLCLSTFACLFKNFI